MPKTINPSEKWTDTLNVPRAGEGVKAAGVELPFSDLLANDKHLKVGQTALEARLAALEAKFAGGTPTTGGGDVKNPVVALTLSLLATAVAGGVHCQASVPAGVTLSALDWDWGDGQTETGTNLSQNHSYNKPGTYVVSVTAHSSAGEVKTATQQVQVSSVLDTADFSVDKTLGNFVQFAAQMKGATDGIQGYLWDFGDGTTDSVSGPTAGHFYKNPGNYTVNLKVMYSDAISATASKPVTVTAPPDGIVGRGESNRIFNFPSDGGHNIIVSEMHQSPHLPGLVKLEVFFQFADGAPSNTAKWDLGDGTTVNSSQTIYHYYATPGPRMVTVANGYLTDMQVSTVKDTYPTAKLVVSGEKVSGPQPMTLESAFSAQEYHLHNVQAGESVTLKFTAEDSFGDKAMMYLFKPATPQSLSRTEMTINPNASETLVIQNVAYPSTDQDSTTRIDVYVKGYLNNAAVTSEYLVATIVLHQN